MICASIELITHPLIFCIKYKQKVLSILDKTAQLADTSSFQNEINTRENHINYSSAHLCCKIVSYFHQSFPMWVRYYQIYSAEVSSQKESKERKNN